MGRMMTLDLSSTDRLVGGSDENVRKIGPPRSLNDLTWTQPGRENETWLVTA